MSVPRTDDRHREKADRRRRPLHQPVSGPDRDPLLPGLATPGLSCAEAAWFQAFRKTAGETLPYLAVGEGLAPPAPAGVANWLTDWPGLPTYQNKSDSRKNSPG